MRIRCVSPLWVWATWVRRSLMPCCSSGLASEIVLIDANRAKAEGEAMDLNHAVPFTHPTRIWAGDYPDCAGASVTVLAAGASQKPRRNPAGSDQEKCRHLARRSYPRW